MPIKFFAPVIPTDVAIKGLENEFNTFEHKEEVEYIQKIGTIQFTENYQDEKEPRLILWCHYKSKS
jgi:hypothetical protein